MNTSAPPARVALITGASGGLGQELAKSFLAQSWRVVAGYRNDLKLAEGENLWPLLLDVTSVEQIQNGVQEVLKRWGRIDVLINNAGLIEDDLISQMEEAAWDRVQGVNLKGAFLCSQAVARPMMKQRDGHIINISSWSGRAGGRGQANYAAAKAGLIGLTTSIARELGSRNVRVNAVLPGVLPTRMTAGLNEEQMAAFAAANALGRINSMEEVARFITFLASMQNVSGQIFQLDSRIGSWT